MSQEVLHRPLNVAVLTVLIHGLWKLIKAEIKVQELIRSC